MYSLIWTGLIYRIDCQEASNKGLLNYSTLKLKASFKYDRAILLVKERAIPITKLPP